LKWCLVITRVQKLFELLPSFKNLVKLFISFGSRKRSPLHDIITHDSLSKYVLHYSRTIHLLYRFNRLIVCVLFLRIISQMQCLKSLCLSYFPFDQLTLKSFSLQNITLEYFDKLFRFVLCSLLFLLTLISTIKEIKVSFCESYFT
jgi:hypothetical protein